VSERLDGEGKDRKGDSNVTTSVDPKRHPKCLSTEETT